MSAPADPAHERPTYEQAYAEHREPLTRFVSRLAGRYGLPDPRRDAEDIVQTTFEEALPQWSSVDNPAGWLYTVARRNTVKAANKAVRRGELIGGDELNRTDRGWTSVTRRPTAEDTILTRQVMDAIADLPDRQRTVTYLRHVQGWSVREVADLLDCAPGTIWAHTNHGVTEIRRLLSLDSDFRYWRIDPVRPSAPGWPRGWFLPVLAGVTMLAVVACLVRWVVIGYSTDMDWLVPWWQVGISAAALVCLIVMIRASVRWWRRRRRSRRP
ncbi:RNA polymerase sigma factor [Virgisporangium aurantiacum]|uniref:RNA polymerase sigma-70 factor, ECF subfamily n=1 Tax=Virgisporangium aurantiacum TaxID=175570 RepID=A0A8J3ZEC2_9ACTN|nr:RNA polymerase sigma factor [Virgisporangium aurantiacum]GIJ60051.1 hypothetical protein Vau01_075670 [Virgisporangium aurantiacum]